MRPTTEWGRRLDGADADAWMGPATGWAGDWMGPATGWGRRLDGTGDWMGPETGWGRRLDGAGDWMGPATGWGRRLDGADDWMGQRLDEEDSLSYDKSTQQLDQFIHFKGYGSLH